MANLSIPSPPPPPKVEEEKDFKPISFQLKPLAALAADLSLAGGEDALARHSTANPPSAGTQQALEPTRVISTGTPDFLAGMFAAAPPPSLPATPVHAPSPVSLDLGGLQGGGGIAPKDPVSLGEFALGSLPLPPSTASSVLPELSLLSPVTPASYSAPLPPTASSVPTEPTELIRDSGIIRQDLFRHLSPGQILQVEQGGAAAGVLTRNGQAIQVLCAWDTKGLYARLCALPLASDFAKGIELSSEHLKIISSRVSQGLVCLAGKSFAVAWLLQRQSMGGEGPVLVVESTLSVQWGEGDFIHSALWGAHLKNLQECLVLVRQLGANLLILEHDPAVFNHASHFESLLAISRECFVILMA